VAEFIRKDATRRTGADTLTISGFATGSSPTTIRYGSGGYSVFGYTHIVTGATLNISFTVEGSVGDSARWTKLTAITTGSTAGSGVINTTAGLVVDNIRITSTANNATTTSPNPLLTVTVVPSV